MASFAEIHKNTTVSAYRSMASTFREVEKPTTDPSEILRHEYGKYIRNKILFDCIQQCAEKDNRIELVINDVQMKQYLKQANHNLLGLNMDQMETLTYQEGGKLELDLQKIVTEKRTKLFKEFKEITRKDIEQVVQISKSPVSPFDSTLMEKDQTAISFKKALMKERETFKENILLRSKLLEDILDVRLRKVPSMCHKVNQDCKTIIEINYLKLKIGEYKTKLDIFMEVPKSIEAYRELLKDIKQQQEECELVINVMKENKMKYENVSGKEYDEILKSYLMYTNSIDKLNKMYALVK